MAVDNISKLEPEGKHLVNIDENSANICYIICLEST